MPSHFLYRQCLYFFTQDFSMFLTNVLYQFCSSSCGFITASTNIVFGLWNTIECTTFLITVCKIFSLPFLVDDVATLYCSTQNEDFFWDFVFLPLLVDSLIVCCRKRVILSKVKDFRSLINIGQTSKNLRSIAYKIIIYKILYSYLDVVHIVREKVVNSKEVSEHHISFNISLFRSLCKPL